MLFMSLLMPREVFGKHEAGIASSASVGTVVLRDVGTLMRGQVGASFESEAAAGMLAHLFPRTVVSLAWHEGDTRSHLTNLSFLNSAVHDFADFEGEERIFAGEWRGKCL